MNGRVALISLAVVSLVACDNKSEIKVYRVSKAPFEEAGPEQQSAVPANAPSPSMPGGMAPAVSSVSVPTSPNWQPQPLSQMRQASFLVKGDDGAVADISFVSLGMSAGNVLENVNRWLSQIGQLPIDEQKLNQIAQHVTTSIGDVTVVDLEGLPGDADPKKDGRIIAGMTTTGNSTLFFKIRGNAALTESQKNDFTKWIAAVCNSQGRKLQQTTSAMPQSSAGNPQIKWQMPPEWNEVPPSAMRYASFNAGANENKVDISIVTFPGDGGNDIENVNRWRGQIGLPPISEAALTSQVTTLRAGDSTLTAIDINGAKARTLAAWVRRDAHVWFFKATGPNAAVEKEKQNFVKFVQSVRF